MHLNLTNIEEVIIALLLLHLPNRILNLNIGQLCKTLKSDKNVSIISLIPIIPIASSVSLPWNTISFSDYLLDFDLK